MTIQNNNMVIIDSDIEFRPGTLYVFATDPNQPDTKYIYGIFDCYDDHGTIKLEVAGCIGDKVMSYGILLPSEYLWTREADSDEIRDFCFDYGFDCGMRAVKEHHMMEPMGNTALDHPWHR